MQNSVYERVDASAPSSDWVEAMSLDYKDKVHVSVQKQMAQHEAKAKVNAGANAGGGSDDAGSGKGKNKKTVTFGQNSYFDANKKQQFPLRRKK